MNAAEPHTVTWHSSLTRESDVKSAQFKLMGGVDKTLRNYSSNNSVGTFERCKMFLSSLK